jgi:hypothetical protein
MKKILIASAVLALAFSPVPNLVGQSKAAPSKSAYCDMAKSQKDPVSWNARYNCLEKPAASAQVVERKRETKPANPYCAMAKSQKDPVSWNAQYGCLSRR